MKPVYFLNLKKLKKKNIYQALKQLFEKSGLNNIFRPRDLVAIKVHFGEEGNTSFVPANYYRPLVEELKKSNCRPFFTDTNTLYPGERSNAVNHILLASRHGFSQSALGAPVIIADGLTGHDGVKVKIKGQHFKEVKIGAALYHADGLLVASHFKGHSLTGFGGAIKNLGMGGACRSSKQMMHSDVKPWVNANKCTGCGRCLAWCPVKAITMEPEDSPDKKIKAVIDPTICYGCGECLITCPVEAISVTWKETSARVQEKMAEFALGLVETKKEKIGYFNFLINISPDCDCWGFSEPPVVADIGMLAATDPVAIDAAALDLITAAVGLKGAAQNTDKFQALYPALPVRTQLSYAEKIGLGTSQYELISIN